MTIERCVPPGQVGMRPGAIAKVIAAFRRQHARGVFPGGQLVVRRRGALVIDEAIGVARAFARPCTAAVAPAGGGQSPVAFEPDTRSCLFSAGKPLVGVAVALLEDRGRVDVRAPVAHYWPEFGQAGKSAISLLDVLTHSSGLFLRDIEADWRLFGDWDGIVARIAASAPSFPRGTLAYQPMGFGWILGEVIRRVTGQSVDRFLAREVLGPAGLEDLRLGVPADEVATLALSYWVDERPPALAGEVLTDFERAQNSVEWLTAVLPGGGTVGTARALARFYEWLLAGTPGPGGTPMIHPTTLASYLTPQVRGTDRTVKVPLVIGRGFALGWLWPHPYGWWATARCYGHGGNFSTLAWADPTTGCAVAYVTNGNRAPMKLVTRCAPIGSGVRGACA